MSKDQLRAVSDALHNGADAILVWGELAPKHTPLPWKWHVGNGANPRCHIQTVGGFQIASTPEVSEHTKANAELICRAVNAHDELLAACKALWEAKQAERERHVQIPWECWKRIQALLANAEKSL